jgi:hypothetical protein
MRLGVRTHQRLVGIALVTLLAGACDDDPSDPLGSFPDFSLAAVPDTLLIEQAIRVIFADSISPATALDPANFVVTNLCTGLRVPGAVRLAGDTLIFTPSQPWPFLVLLGIRIQNLLTPAGVSQPLPITFQRVTAPPPIRDQSWEFLNSPTDDNLTGVAFVSDERGYISESGGTIYRTTDGGLTFVAIFKSVDISFPGDLRAFGPDTLFFVASRRVGNTVERALFRSVNGGVSFTPVVTAPEILYINAMRGVNGVPEGVFGGVLGAPALYRYFGSTNTASRATGIPGSGWLTTGADLSPTATVALASFRGTQNPSMGAAVRSLDGGLTYSSLSLPANVYGLAGVGFQSDTVGFVLGDSSVVLRFNPSATAPTFTAVGAAQGIPQTELGSNPGDITAYSFSKVQFAPGSPTGWMVGVFTRRRQGVPNVQGGVILQSDDRGQTWRRQAIRGALENGLAFPAVLDVQARRPDFAALTGLRGLAAARIAPAQSGTAACSLPTTP